MEQVEVQEQVQALAAIIAIEALNIMADRAGTTPENILFIVDTDPEGETAQYFRDLMSAAAATARTHGPVNAPGTDTAQ